MKIKDLAINGIFSDGDWVESKDQDSNGNIRLIQLADIGDGYFVDKSNRFMNEETTKRLNCTFLEKDDIIVARMPDPIGRCCLFPFEEKRKYVTVVDVCILRIGKNAIPKYVMYALNSPISRHKIEGQVTGTTRERITKKKIGELEIPLPPLATQQKIAAILDAADAYRQKTKTLIAKYDQLAQSLFLDMFGDPVRNKKIWEENTVEEICLKICGGGTPSKSKPEYFKGNIPWVTPKDMKSIKIMDSIDHINEEAIQNSSTNLIESGAILMVIRSGILKHTLPVAINVVDVAINQDMKAFFPNSKKIIPLYLLYFFITGQRSLLSKVRAVTADNIEFKQIKELIIPVPPISLQNKFAERIQLIEAQKQQAQASLQKAENLFNSLLQRAFKGELG